MKRETSRKAYNALVITGVLPLRQAWVYNDLYKYGPVTANELSIRGAQSEYCHKRLPELRKLGYVKECGTKKCSVTGRTAIVWDCTSKCPKKKNK